MPRLLITVDTELSNFPRGMGIWGQIGGIDWGLPRLISIFDAIELQATFFLDVYGGNDVDVAEQRRAAELIVKSGHDLQLHTHPGPAFDRRRDRLHHYSPQEQADIIGLGRERIEQWTGVRAVLHRAGDWAADHNSIKALQDQQFRADFSASRWSKHCRLDGAAIDGNGWTRIDGMLCGVGTCYFDRLTGRVRRVDLGGASYREALDILSRRIDPLFLTLHSFSLLRFDKTRTHFSPNPEYVDQLKDFCQVARTRWGYATATALEAVDEIATARDAQLPWVGLPTTRTTSSLAGIMKSIQGRLSALAN